MHTRFKRFLLFCIYLVCMMKGVVRHILEWIATVTIRKTCTLFVFWFFGLLHTRRKPTWPNEKRSDLRPEFEEQSCFAINAVRSGCTSIQNRFRTWRELRKTIILLLVRFDYSRCLRTGTNQFSINVIILKFFFFFRSVKQTAFTTEHRFRVTRNL